MLNPQMTSSQMELLPLVCLCLLSWSGTTSADQPVVVEEGSDVILPCSFGVDIVGELLEWMKDGQKVLVYNGGIDQSNPKLLDRLSHFKDELKHGNASLKITNTKVADSGDYTCDTSLDSSQPVHVKLYVGTAPKPYIKTVGQTNNWARLQCEAHGVPDLEVHWQDSDGNILPAEKSQVTERGGREYITLVTTVTKTDNFSCVATQKNISHTISADTLVHLNGNTGWIVTALVSIALVVVGVVLLVVLIATGCIKLNCNKGYEGPGTA